MNIMMKNVAFANIEDINKFLLGNDEREFLVLGRDGKYSFITETLVSLRYNTLRKKDKGSIKKCLQKITGYEDRQMKRLIKEWKSKKGLRYRKPKKRGATIPKYKTEDIALLIKTDIAHKTPNGKSVQETLKREFSLFGKEEYRNISKISVSHIYNLRNHKKQYLSSEAIKYSKTIPVTRDIGERRKPAPCGKTWLSPG